MDVGSDTICMRCRAFTIKLEEVSLMANGKVIKSWPVCDVCRRKLRIEDLLRMAENDLNAANQ